MKEYQKLPTLGKICYVGDIVTCLAPSTGRWIELNRQNAAMQ